MPDEKELIAEARAVMPARTDVRFGAATWNKYGGYSKAAIARVQAKLEQRGYARVDAHSASGQMEAVEGSDVWTNGRFTVAFRSHFGATSQDNWHTITLKGAAGSVVIADL